MAIYRKVTKSYGIQQEQGVFLSFLCYNCVIVVHKAEKSGNGAEKVFWRDNTWEFFKARKAVTPKYRKFSKLQTYKTKKNHIWRHYRQSIENKKKDHLKREKRHWRGRDTLPHYLQRITVRLTADFSMETTEARDSGMKSLKCRKKKSGNIECYTRQK